MTDRIDPQGSTNIAQSNLYQRITTATTTTVKSLPGFLHSIIVGTTSAGSITIDDALTATTPTIAVLKASIPEGVYVFDCNFTIGLTIVTAGASDITVIYHQEKICPLLNTLILKIV